MTTDLEKQFFSTFGIEPKYEAHTCDGWGRTIEVKFFANKEEAKRFGILIGDEPKYPQITDRILLELICICSQYGFCPTARNIKDLKLNVLKRLLELKKNLKNNYKHQSYHNAFTRKVQALFKEG